MGRSKVKVTSMVKPDTFTICSGLFVFFSFSDPAYANKLLDVSQQLYKFGHEVQGNYFDKTPEARGRYV